MGKTKMLDALIANNPHLRFEVQYRHGGRVLNPLPVRFAKADKLADNRPVVKVPQQNKAGGKPGTDPLD